MCVCVCASCQNSRAQLFLALSYRATSHHLSCRSTDLSTCLSNKSCETIPVTPLEHSDAKAQGDIGSALCCKRSYRRWQHNNPNSSCFNSEPKSIAKLFKAFGISGPFNRLTLPKPVQFSQINRFYIALRFNTSPLYV